MKFILFLISIMLTQMINAQIFTAAAPPPEFEDVVGSSVDFSDVNGDGNNDVLITGISSSQNQIAKLYLNDGAGNFTEMMDIPFLGVGSGSISFSDVNIDGSDDILITGGNNSGEAFAKLYINDGNGNFTEVIDTPFDGVLSSSIAFSDINGDGFEDVLITGSNNSSERIAKLYVNDGTGNFIELIGTPFTGVYEGSVAFSDVNGDGFDDVLITGTDSYIEKIAKLYINDGTGNFNESIDTPFIGVSASSVAFSDVNSDGFNDVLITGTNNSIEKTAILYENDGMGNFTKITNTPFPEVTGGNVIFSDLNNDGTDDLIITGKSNIERIAKLYINDGAGNFTEITDTPFVGVSGGSATFSDVNNDGKDDVLITGLDNSFEITTKLYINEGVVSVNNDLKNKFRSNLNIFPIPSSSLLFINYESTVISKVTIQIYNELGILIKEEKEVIQSEQQNLSLDISLFPKGKYFIKIDNGRNIDVGKFIVQ